MVQITKDERDYLEKNGARWQKDLHKTYSKHPKYYVTTSPKMEKLLMAYRDSHTTYTKF